MSAAARVAHLRLWAVQFGGFRHYVRESTSLERSAPTLCGRIPSETINKPKWRLLKALNGDSVCGTCHAAACREPSVVVFPS